MKVEEVVQEGFYVFKENWLSLILATIIAAVGSIFIITAPPLFFGLYAMAIRAVEGESIEVSDVFKGFNYFGTSLVMAIVAAIAITIGLMLLVIPGLLLAVLFTYAIPLAIKEKLGGIDALKKSYNISKENFEFTLILSITLWIINAIGGAIHVGTFITLPFSAVCISIATMKITPQLPKNEELEETAKSDEQEIQEENKEES